MVCILINKIVQKYYSKFLLVKAIKKVSDFKEIELKTVENQVDDINSSTKSYLLCVFFFAN